MTVQGNFQVQGMIEQSPKGFNWAMFPPLKGKTQDQAANPQTLSISQQSEHKAEAMQFIAYALNTENMAKLAQGDWLIPVAPAAAAKVVKSTKHYGSWRNAISAVPLVQEGELGAARPVPALEGGGRDAAVQALSRRTRSTWTSWSSSSPTDGTASALRGA